jgi:polygalacturonase
MRNILDYGAVGDGVTVNTKAIQAAIDAGGIVHIPAGVFVTGTIHLRSNGGLYLDHGAVLKASHDHADYNAPDYCPQNRVFPSESMAGTHLISAVEESNVSITGFGKIDGDSHHWVNEKHTTPHGFFGHPPLEDNRPAQMVFFAECKNVTVEGVTLYQAPFWHLFFHGCEDVKVHGLTIEGERRQWVNDGIDIDTCKRVTVSDCIIDTGDDGITLRAATKNLLHSDGVCEDVTVTNCIIRSYLDYGIRVGVGDGLIRDCLFSNIIIRDSLKGIGIVNRFSAASRGVSVENLRFQNVSIKAHEAIDVRICNLDHFPACEAPIYTKDITFHGVTAYSNRGSMIADYAGAETSRITLSDVDFHMAKEEPNDRSTCDWRDLPHKDAALYVRGVKELTLEGVRFFHADDDGFTHDVLREDAKINQ